MLHKKVTTYIILCTEWVEIWSYKKMGDTNYYTATGLYLGNYLLTSLKLITLG